MCDCPSEGGNKCRGCCNTGTIVTQGCCSKLPGDPICKAKPQPISPANPELSLQGQNRVACYNERLFNTKVSDLNQNIDIMSNDELKLFLSTPVVVPAIDVAKAQYVVNPPINPVGCNNAVFPTPSDDPLPPNNRRVLIIGGYKGLGKATAEYLANNGFIVTVTSSRPDAYEPILGVNYTMSNVPLDVRCEFSVSAFFKTQVKDSLDAIIYMPGAHSRGMSSTYTGDDLRNCLELKLFGAQRCIYYSKKFLRRGVSPRFIIFSSVAGGEKFLGSCDMPYNVGNHALSELTFSQTLDERVLYGAGEISNPISYTVIYPILILSTIGLYAMQKPKDGTIFDHWANAWQSVIGAGQSGLLPGFDVDPASLIGEQIHMILTYKQPSVNYYVGDPNSMAGPLPWIDFITAVNATPIDNAINGILIPFANSTINTGLANYGKNALLNYYFPPP